ncbi:MAG: nucleotide exchange factor GrpE [Candidatus Coatesbacteria bacterium]|nr:nucleotide exchange factor GrpE [Candidatus Coatesbacteria bacterium]
MSEEVEKEAARPEPADASQEPEASDGSDGPRPRTSVYKDELAELKEKAASADEYLDSLRRSQAEFANFRRRWEKERQQIVLYGEQDLVKDLLVVLDNFERAIAAARETDSESPLLKGIVMVYEQLTDTLGKRGLKRIEAKGKEFDPNVHEAVSQTCSMEVPDNHVLEELQPGYMFQDRLLRPAMVRVAKACH